jgi:hypothetical protein
MSSPNRNCCWEYPGTKFAEMQSEPMMNGDNYKEILTNKMEHIPPPKEYGEKYQNLIASMV